MGISVLPQPNFPTVGESLSALGPDLARILHPNREAEQEAEAKAQQLRAAILTTPGAMQNAAQLIRDNPSASMEFAGLVGEDFTSAIKRTPEDLDQRIERLTTDEFTRFASEDAEGFAEWIQSNAGIPPKDVIGETVRGRVAELISGLSEGRMTVEDLTPEDQGFLTNLGFDFGVKEEPTTPSNVGAVNAIRARLLDESVNRPDLASTASIEAFITDPNSPEGVAVRDALASVRDPVELETGEDRVASRRILADVHEINPGISLAETDAYVVNPDLNSPVGIALTEKNRRDAQAASTAEARRVRSEQSGNFNRIDSMLDAASNVIRDFKGGKVGSRGFNETINSLNNIVGTINRQGLLVQSSGGPLIRAEVFSKELTDPGLFTSERGEPLEIRITIDGEPVGTESSIGAIESAVAGFSGAGLTPDAQEVLRRINAHPDREEALSDLRQNIPALYAELVRAGKITP